MREVRLLDKYESRSEPVLLNGVQALVRLMLLQADADKAAGLNTGGFVSGYRGSPLGGVDTAFAGAGNLVTDRGIVVKPGVNENLAATAIAGTQQIEQSPGAKVDGVFSLWYGKGPGLDQASDAVRHGVQQGTSRKGGVVLAVGDDHMAKSSSIVCRSDDVVAGLQVPLFYPADPNEIVEYGLHAFALSRHTGSWTALKIITEIGDATRSAPGNELPFKPVFPPIDAPPIGLHNRWPDTPLEQENRHVTYRLPAIADYVHANKLDRIVLKGPNARIGLVSTGKSWLDMREALRLLGLTDEKLEELGIALYKPAMIWPLEARRLEEFASGLDTVIVVEEKAAFVETQAKEILYNLDRAPSIYGKRDAEGKELLPAIADLTPEKIAAALSQIIADVTGRPELVQSRERMAELLGLQVDLAVPPQIRKPFFCSGCPHNRSTKLPDGSRALAGIGCHGLAAYNEPTTASFSQMGGEGVGWAGLAPFTNEPHIFSNIGDGTYFHSGLMAIRQSVAANVNITYKLLYNGAVAMTGGQQVDGELSIPQIVDQLLAEGVKQVVICADDLSRYPSSDPVRSKVKRIVHRDDMDALQREMREQKGVTAIIYDQMCATEKRRLRKRGKLDTPAQSVFINESVCEGCGDCSVKSNCLSVEPVATPLGTKRRINQSSCNKDFSCLEGFCPSFVTVEGGKTKRGGNKLVEAFDPASLPLPTLPEHGHQRVIVAGVGGTGVVTIGALISMATHMSGRNIGVLDQTGMAQKGGAVISHLQIADDQIYALRTPTSDADLVIACDQVVANQRDVIAAIDPKRTRVVANADVSITGDFTRNVNATPDSTLLVRRLEKRTAEGNLQPHPFTRLAESLFGDAIASNLMMVGYAWQMGWLAVEMETLIAALELNGAAVKMNKAAFAWGRRLAAEPKAVYEIAGLIDPPKETLDDMIARRVKMLTDYQDAAYAARYANRITAIRNAEDAVGGSGQLTEAAAQALYRLMAYKDEYEVARLMTDGSFAKKLGETFDGDLKLTYHLAAPIVAKRDPVTGQARKRSFGAWMTPVLRLLAKGRVLRGTALDPLGYMKERREERAMITQYETLLDDILAKLNADNLEQAARVAGMVLEVRGFGHVKQAAAERYNKELPKAFETFANTNKNNADFAQAV